MRTPPLPSPNRETDALGNCTESSSQPTTTQELRQPHSQEEMQLSSNSIDHVASRRKARLNARVVMPESAYRPASARKPLPTPLSKSFSAHSTPTPERTSPTPTDHTGCKVHPKSAAPGPSLSSYPFPNMRAAAQKGPLYQMQGLRSPSVTEIMERALSSGTPTPASFNFLPPGVGQEQLACSNPEFPTPNLYDLSLLLNSEPGLEGFWANLVTIMTRCYKAERMSLSVPTDLTDLENTPWGQKASFHQSEDDTLSLTYFGDGGIGDDEKAPTESSDDDQGVPLNEGTEDYWSGSADGGNRRNKLKDDDDNKDPGELSFVASEGPFSPITVDVSELHSTDPIESPLPTPIDPSQDYFSEGSGGYLLQQPCPPANRLPKGRVFPTLQPLNYEADALLDGAGVSRILQRGKVVVLSREYRDPALTKEDPNPPRENKKTPKWNLKTDTAPQTPTKTPKPSKAGLKISLDDLNPFSNSPPATPLEFVGKRLRGNQPKDQRRPGQDLPFLPFSSSHYHQQHHSQKHRESSTYDEYEQLVTSPWSQSPAASPAPKRDPSENPFFVAPSVDERSFSPDDKTPDFIPQNNVEAIGLESAWTVIHIPLIHPTVYRPFNSTGNKSQHQDARPLGNTLTVEGAGTVANTPAAGPMFGGFERKAPIAILSILSSAIPYPKNLIQSLKHLAPIMATSYSLAHGYSTVMNQLDNLREEAMHHRHEQADTASVWNNYPSDSSASASESASSNYVSARNSQMTSPAYTTATDSLHESEASAFESGLQNGESSKKSTFWPFSRQNSGVLGAENSAPRFPRQRDGRDGLDELLNKISEQPSEDSTVWVDLKVPSPQGKETEDPDSTDSRRTIGGKAGRSKRGDTSSGNEQSSTSKKPRSSRRRRGKRVGGGHHHSVLHSHGADYSATFQTMAPTLVPANEVDAKTSPGSSYAMPPPSNRLLRTIIDAIPVHVFTAEPNTGEMTWVNARYLTYCGFPPTQVKDCVRESVHPEDRDEHTRHWNASIHKGEPYSRQIRLRRFDGEYRWFMVRMVPLRDSKGGIAHWFGTNMDVHDQRSAEVNAAIQAEVAESESKYRSLANSSPQIVFAATAEQGVTFANDQWLEYSGQTLEEALHLGFMDFVHPLERNRCGLPVLHGLDPGECPDVPIDLTSDGKGVYSMELRLRNKHGEYRWHLVRCVSVETNFGTGEGMWFGTCTDINDQKLVQEKLKEANEAAQKTMESKTRFLANMSHEIRTPLIGISGMVNFLLDTPLNVEQLDYCHTISSSSDGLLTVINDILDLSKVEAGMMRLNAEWFRIHSLIEDANELLSTLAISKNLELNYIVEEDVPPIVCGDRVRLRQVLLNVIGNAIKFTNQGEVFARCSVVDDAEVDKEEVMLQFECHDTGPGFDSKEAELMFKPFSQIDASSTRTHGGSGLGLVISRQLIELHGGSMHAYSEKGKGATFICTAKFKLPAEGSFQLANLPRSASQKDFEKLTGTYRRASFSSRPGSPFDKTLEEAFNRDSPQSSPGGAVEEELRSPTPPPQLTEEQEHHLTQILPPMSLLEDHQTDVGSMRLAIPPDVAERALQYRAPSVAASGTSRSSIDVDVGRALTPPMFSILIVGEHKYSRMATAHHIRVTLPPSIPSQITEVSEYTECHNLIAGEDPVVFTHIVINLPEASEIIELVSQVLRSSMHALTTVIVLTNPMQRTAIMEGCGSSSKKLETRVQFIYKPIKPSRFAIIFDPTQERDASTDRYRDTAQQVADNQKRVFSDMEKEVGGKGHQILLVEDNNVNQKVLLRFLHKAGLSVETAGDGVECVEKVLAAGAGRYGLILCDLHMPRKDGFQACSEIRQWEKENGYAPVPIVALSANVMSDVAERCVAAGFSRYVTKPVDFKALGQTIKELLVDKDPKARHTHGGNLDGISPSSTPLPEVKEDREAEKKAEAEKDARA